MINNVNSQNSLRVSTSVVNEVINEAISVIQPPSDKGKRLKIYYGTQASTKPPTFVIFVNDKELMHFSYTRYLENQIRDAFGFKGTSLRFITRERAESSINKLKQQLKEEAVKLYEAKEAEFPDSEAIREVERVILLKVIDRKWMNHIDDMDQLRQGAGLAAYGSKDPVVEYKMAGYDMFDAMTMAIKEETIRMLFRVRVEQNVEREQVAKVTGTNKDTSLAKGPIKREEAKVYPNDPCPCGSGKKYKQCCGKNA